MSSHTDVAELRQTLEAIRSILNEIKRDIPKLKKDAKETGVSLREVEYLFQRTTSLFREFGLPDDVDSAIGKLTALALAVRALHASVLLLQTGGTYGVIVGLIGIAATLVSLGYAMDLQRPVY